MRGLTEVPSHVKGIGDVHIHFHVMLIICFILKVLTHQHSHFDYESATGDLVHVSTLPNPSHLEVILIN